MIIVSKPKISCSIVWTLKKDIAQGWSGFYTCVDQQVARLENQVLAEEGKRVQLEEEMESFFKDLNDV